MKTVFSEPVEYYLSVGNNELKMNDLIGKQILIEYLGETIVSGVAGKQASLFSRVK